MAISKKNEKGPQGYSFRNNRMPFDFNAKVEGINAEVLKHCT